MIFFVTLRDIYRSLIVYDEYSYELRWEGDIEVQQFLEMFTRFEELVKDLDIEELKHYFQELTDQYHELEIEIEF